MLKNFKKFLIFAIILNTFLFSNISFVSAKDVELYLGGFTAGFTIKNEGLTVVSINEVKTDKGDTSPAKTAGLKVGDVILSIDGKTTLCAGDLSKILANCKGEALQLIVLRKGNKIILDVLPEKNVLGEYKIGVYLRDSISGIGTVTYVKNNGEFASLGHPIVDDDGNITVVSGGEVFECSVIGVNPSKRNKAGELRGMFIGDKPTGEIVKNTKSGLYGKLYDVDYSKLKPVQSGVPKMGKAKLYSTVDGVVPKYYDIEIVKCDLITRSDKNLVVKITDEELLKYTGGILQGMSGSPIIQNGKLVGAVTHVFINDSSRGFGIDIKNMLKE